MSVKIIQERLDSYHCKSEQEEMFALKEICQEIALAALSRTAFFKSAAFQGGTALRILYSLDRFSEDLDFILKKSDPNFIWSSYLKNVQLEFEAYGIELHVADRSQADQTVKKAFLKDDSIGQLLILKQRPRDRRIATIKVKFELDTHPPAGSRFDIRYPDFPFPFGVTVQDLPSLFAGKSHALLCREYTKGRDWYDFLWYVAREVPPNYELLANACEQLGPWQGQKPAVDRDWYLEALYKKITTTDWRTATQDVARFLRARELQNLKLWKRDFFLDRLEKIKRYL